MPWASVRDNVAFGLELQGVPKEVRRAKADVLIELVGLTDFANRLPGQLRRS
jgi:glycine betaine/proline transport system ATP-binding protein